jgi:hypothetical protein
VDLLLLGTSAMKKMIEKLATQAVVKHFKIEKIRDVVE